jgi:LacI family transcriptional regulator
MGKPTVNDIAREAGVSLATVDRVLNARPGVRAKTIVAVNDAISRLGYVRDMAAANLARGRSYRFAVVVPATPSQFVGTLVAALDEAASQAAASRTEVDLLRYPPEDVHGLAALLGGLSAECTGVALMAPETPVVRDAVNALRRRGLPLVTLVSDLPNTERSRFVGIDSHAAGRTAGLLMGRFLGGRTGRVMVLAQSMLLRDSIERRRGFDEVMQAEFPEVEVLQTLESHGSAATLREAMAETIRNEGAPGGIYLLGSGYRALADALASLDLSPRPMVIGHDLTPYARAGLEAGWLHAVVTQNIGHLARSALRVLRARADGLPIDEEQERLRIEIMVRENLPAEAGEAHAVF